MMLRALRRSCLGWRIAKRCICLQVWADGRTGSTATPALARLARKAGLHTVALVGMPLEWEGERRRTAALHALESLRGHAAETVVVYGDALAERLGEDATLDQWMAEFDAALFQELDARLAAKARPE